MYQVIIHKRNDGSVGVIWPSPQALASGVTIEDMIPQDIDDGEECRITPLYDLPSSREFREAWCDETASPVVDIDLVKAKDIQLNRLREERLPYLESSDVEITRAMETNNTEEIEAIKAKRQALRDATEALKQLEVSGYNDEEALNQIRELGALPQNLKE